MPTKSAPLEALLTFINSNNLHNRDYSNKFAPFTNLKFYIMKDLRLTILNTKSFLTVVEDFIVREMTSVESEVDIEGSSDSFLLQNYNTCGYILAAVRDIKKELESDGK